MEERNEPRYAAGQELTLHPGDPVRGAELLQDRDQGRDQGPDRRDARPKRTPEDPDEPETMPPDDLDETLQMEMAAEPVPDLRTSPTGGPAFGATQEPEYATTGPDGRSADPDAPVGHRPALGPVTQDDPMPMGHHAYPDQGSEGDLTLVAVFEDITGAKSCAEDLERRGLGVEVLMVSRRGDGPEQGLRPGNVITGPGYGLSAEDQSPPKDPGMGSGVAVGATIGATAGLLAATWFIPQFGATLVQAPALLTTIAGAGLGSFLGGLSEFTTSEQQDGDDATLYAGQVRRGGVLLLVRTGREDAERVRRLIDLWSPLEIRVQ
jgi:hypothetical protein